MHVAKTPFDKYPLLRTVDLSGLKFIQFKTDLVAARALYHSHSIKKSSNKESIRFKCPLKGSTCLKFIRRYRMYE
jgi:hypothetical protein